MGCFGGEGRSRMVALGWRSDGKNRCFGVVRERYGTDGDWIVFMMVWSAAGRG